MRIAVVSDIHGNLPALEAVLADIQRHAVDLAVNLGDCVSAPLWPVETLQALDAWKVPTVRGNHDRWLTDDAKRRKKPIVAFTAEALGEESCARLAALPGRIDLAEGVVAVHGTPASDTEYLLEDAFNDRLHLAPPSVVRSRLEGITASLVLCGHSHHQHAVMVGRDMLVVNPGSVGHPRAAGNDAPEANEAGSPHARYAVATRSNARWSLTFHALAYGWDAVVDRARANGYAEWAQGYFPLHA